MNERIDELVLDILNVKWQANIALKRLEMAGVEIPDIFTFDVIGIISRIYGVTDNSTLQVLVHVWVTEVVPCKMNIQEFVSRIKSSNGVNNETQSNGKVCLLPEVQNENQDRQA